MATRNYLRISGLIFVLVAIAHAYRAILGLQLVVGTTQVYRCFAMSSRTAGTSPVGISITV
ncbi:MAG: hypothetical protein ABJC13_05165 [Acidobacteriota bacterium]